jgi:hypothetical protein
MNNNIFEFYETEENNYDIYSENGLSELIEDDEITPDEEGFMRGYNNEL